MRGFGREEKAFLDHAEGAIRFKQGILMRYRVNERIFKGTLKGRKEVKMGVL